MASSCFILPVKHPHEDNKILDGDEQRAKAFESIQTRMHQKNLSWLSIQTPDKNGTVVFYRNVGVSFRYTWIFCQCSVSEHGSCHHILKECASEVACFFPIFWWSTPPQNGLYTPHVSHRSIQYKIPTDIQDETSWTEESDYTTTKMACTKFSWCFLNMRNVTPLLKSCKHT